MPKTHLYNYVKAAWEAHASGAFEDNVATHQTACGYVRKIVTKDHSKVTCKHCLRTMQQGGML